MLSILFLLMLTSRKTHTTHPTHRGTQAGTGGGEGVQSCFLMTSIFLEAQSGGEVKRSGCSFFGTNLLLLNRARHWIKPKLWFYKLQRICNIFCCCCSENWEKEIVVPWEIKSFIATGPRALHCNLIFSASLRDPGTPEISETTSNYFTRRLGKLVPAYPSEKEGRGVDCMQLTLWGNLVPFNMLYPWPLGETVHGLKASHFFCCAGE